MSKLPKISRQAIKQTLKETPIEHILVGAHNVEKVKLTKKQKDFARKVAEGKPKAKAYRETYETTASPQSQAEQASKLAKNPKIKTMIDALTLANEAREYLIPAQIRTMAIQNLVNIAIDDEEKTSNKLKALELIGKMSEVSLFTERKELIHTHNAEDIKQKLIEGLRQAFANSRQVNDLAKIKAESLLLELQEARTIDQEPPSAEDGDETPPPFEDVEPADPPPPSPQILTDADSEPLHSNLHTQSQADSDSLLNDLTLTAVNVTKPLESDTCVSIGNYPNEEVGEGVSISGQPAIKVPRETPPVSDSEQKG